MNAINPADGIRSGMERKPGYHVRPDSRDSTNAGNASFISHLDALLPKEGTSTELKPVLLPRERRTPDGRFVLVSEKGLVLNPGDVCAVYSSNPKSQKPTNVWYG